MTKEERKILEQVLPKENVKELSRLLKNYDSYILKFKKQVQTLVDPINMDVKVGLAFINRSNKSEE